MKESISIQDDELTAVGGAGFRKTGTPDISESPLHPRRKSRRIMVGPVPVGGGAPISVQSMTNTPTVDVNATLRQIGELAQALNVKICVEGIDTAVLVAILEPMNVHMIQGYYFGRPMTRKDFEEKFL